MEKLTYFEDYSSGKCVAYRFGRGVVLHSKWQWRSSSILPSSFFLVLAGDVDLRTLPTAVGVSSSLRIVGCCCRRLNILGSEDEALQRGVKREKEREI